MILSKEVLIINTSDTNYYWKIVAVCDLQGNRKLNAQHRVGRIVKPLISFEENTCAIFDNGDNNFTRTSRINKIERNWLEVKLYTKNSIYVLDANLDINHKPSQEVINIIKQYRKEGRKNETKI